MRRILTSVALAVAYGLSPSFALDSPSLLNYQGVLRDASGQPLDGSFDTCQATPSLTR